VRLTRSPRPPGEFVACPVVSPTALIDGKNKEYGLAREDAPPRRGFRYQSLPTL